MISSATLSQQLIDIAIAAGHAILDIYDRPELLTLKEDSSPLTEADLKADAVIRTRLQRLFPDWPIWSEESRSETGDWHGPFFLVDPLDGTKEFLRRSGEFTVNIALIENGRATHSVVYAPVLDVVYAAATGSGAWKISRERVQTPLACQTVNVSKPLRIIGSRSHGLDAQQHWLERLNRPYQLQSVGSSLKICRLAEGLADVYPRLGPTSQWDIAAAQCVLENAGGSILTATGTPLRYGADRPTLNSWFLALADATLFAQLPDFMEDLIH
ncbi:MAG: 3'(2'),5'-bisphosphate nucleotidase CysQ [Methylococcales bacterium]|nr:3'(2'),5'-bisphosphate nucleotidase CysQ [Methylococcales bacterium]